jgi:signal transduction histidine kinase
MRGKQKFRQLRGWGNPGQRIKDDEAAAAALIGAISELLRAAIQLRPDLASLDDEGLLDLAFQLVTGEEPPPDAPTV